LAELAKRYDVHIQSHISESKDEVEFVHFLHPDRGGGRDAEIFDELNLLTNKTILAHGNYITDQEAKLLKKRGAAISHCPLSNVFFAHKIFPLHHFSTVVSSSSPSFSSSSSNSLKIGLGTDVAGGYAPTMLNAIRQAVISHHILAAMEDVDSIGKINYLDGFWFATMGGAIALGIEQTIGSLNIGKDFDALVIDTSPKGIVPFDVFATDSIHNIFEKFINLGDDRNIVQVYIQGKLVFEKEEA